jgi:hypothetical protein
MSGSGRVLDENINVTSTIEKISIYWQASSFASLDLVLMNGSSRVLDENINVTKKGLLEYHSRSPS